MHLDVSSKRTADLRGSARLDGGEGVGPECGMGSPAVRPDDQYGQLLDRLVDRMADIAAATARAVRASIPAYDKVWDVVGPAVERVVLETNLHLVDMWRTGYRPDAEQLARLGRIGLPRAEL